MLSDESEIDIKVSGRPQVIRKTWAEVKEDYLVYEYLVDEAEKALTNKYRYHNSDIGLTLRLLK